jgi:hypothetical protein
MNIWQMLGMCGRAWWLATSTPVEEVSHYGMTIVTPANLRRFYDIPGSPYEQARTNCLDSQDRTVIAAVAAKLSH